jgi:hypothetical protein
MTEELSSVGSRRQSGEEHEANSKTFLFIVLVMFF